MTHKENVNIHSKMLGPQNSYKDPLLPANWIFQFSDRLSSQWTIDVQNVALCTGHYEILLLFTWHWLSCMMNSLQKKERATSN